MLPRKSIRLPRISIQRPALFWSGVALLLVGLSLPLGLPEFIHAYREDINAVSTIFIAVFTAVLGIFTISLARSTRIAANAAKDAAEAGKIQAAVARQSLTDLERPYIFIFGVGQIRPNKEGDAFFVEYTVANYGKMPAIIEGAWIDFVIDNAGKPPSPVLLWEGHQLLASPILQPGEKRERIKGYTPLGLTDGSVAVLLSSDNGPITGDEPVAPIFTVEDGFDVYFRATIAYRGPFSTGHATGALWLYMPGSFEFVVRGGDKYNYVR